MSLAAGYAMKKRMATCGAHGMSDCGECMAKGGEAKKPRAEDKGSDEGEEGIVDRIMGRFAKPAAGETMADRESNDFDYMDQIPEMNEADYDGENSGDETGDPIPDEPEDDVVSRAMRSRAKKTGYRE